MTGARLLGTRYGRKGLTDAIAEFEGHPDKRRKAVHMCRRAGALLAGGLLYDEIRVRAALRDALTGEGYPAGEAERFLREIEHGKATPAEAPDGQMLRDRVDVREQVLHCWLPAVEAAEWSGRRGASALKVLHAFKSLALRVGKLRLEESYREVAEQAGVSLDTLHRALPLIAPYVAIVEKGNRGVGNRTVWQLIPRAPVSEQSAFGGVVASGLFGNARLADNRWHGRSVCWRLYGMLTDDPQPVAVLAPALAVHPGTVRRNLARLVADGLAERTADGWVAIPHAAAREYDGPDFEGDRRLRHVRDRELHRRWIDALTTAANRTGVCTVDDGRRLASGT